MKTRWGAWPQSKLGWVSIFLAGTAALAFVTFSLWVKWVSRIPDGPAFAINFGVVPALMAFVSIFIAILAFTIRHDRSIILLLVSTVLSAQMLFIITFEVLEAKF
jgi:hypothetical protein